MVVIPGEEFVLESIIYGYLLALIEKFGLDEKKRTLHHFSGFMGGSSDKIRIVFHHLYNAYFYDIEAIRYIRK